MKFLTKNADYAIRALIVMSAHRDQLISARHISEGQNIPYQFLRRILRELIDHGLILSKEGGQGGFQLKKDPTDITVEEVIKIFRGKIQVSDCMFKKRLCENRSKCVLRKRLQNIEQMVISEFSKTTIEDLIKETKRTK